MPPVKFRYHTLACKSMKGLAFLSRPIARIGLIVELDRNLLVTTKDAEMAGSPAIEEITFIGVSGLNGEFLPARLRDSEVCALVSFPYLALTC